MILYLEFQKHGRRGGELYHRKLRAFLCEHYPDVFPSQLGPLPDNVRRPRHQIQYCLSLVRQYTPQLIVSDISSAARNFAAVRYGLKHGAQLLLVVQAEPRPPAGKSRFRQFVTRRCESYLFGHTAAAVVNSRFTESVVRRHVPPEMSVVVAYPGLDVAPRAESIPGKDSQTVRLLYVGEISRVKGLRYLVEAIARLKEADIEVDVVGGHTQEPDYATAVMALVKRHGLSDRVHFHGYADREQLNDFYAAADILVAPSLSEGYGMMIAEGYCFGLPVIASHAGAIPEIVSDGDNGFLVPPGKPEALAAAIKKLVANPELRRKMGAANLAKARVLPMWDDFTYKLNVGLLLILNEMLESGPRS